MNFNKHLTHEGLHAFLSASKYHWLRYDDDKIMTAYANHRATAHGTLMHDFAAQCIRLGQKLPRSTKTLNMYVNDAIGYKMTPEQMLFYSGNCFGTADAISFREKSLRIHDYKSGVTPAHMEQLQIYAALFCLEYQVKPEDIDIELRLYQSNEVTVDIPTPDDVHFIMDKIVAFDTIIDKMKSEEV